MKLKRLKANCMCDRLESLVVNNSNLETQIPRVRDLEHLSEFVKLHHHL